MDTKGLKMRVAAGAGGIVRWSIEHPYIIIAFYVGVVVLAVMAVFAMPRRMMPYVESPMIGVVSMMPGLSAEEMELYISKPIEEQLVNVKNLNYIRSTSQDGFSIVSLEFHYGTDMKKALFDVQSLMNIIQASLPATGANLKPSWVLAIDPLNLPVLSLALTGEGWDPVELREFADNEVVNRLKTIKDVYSVVTFGGFRKQLQVIVDRERLASYNLTMLDLVGAIDQFNVARPGGTLTHGGAESIVRLDNRVVTADQLAAFPLRSFSGAALPASAPPPSGGMGGMGMGAVGMGGSEMGAPPAAEPRGGEQPRIIYLRDVARVEETHWERRSAYHFYDRGEVKPAIEVSVLQNPEASSAKVVPQVLREIKELEKEHPGVKFDVAYDNAHFVNILFENMFHELGVAILLTGLAVLFFLGEWRGTLISLVAIPTSLAMAVLGLIPFGFTLNSGTLIGLLLSIGRLVDDSIIDIHAVFRHLKMGKDIRNATIDGISEVRLAVIASTIVICLALLPLIFSGGITELMFVQLVWPLIFGLLASMLVSFTLTPLLSVHLLRSEEARAKEKGWLIYRLALNPFQRFLDWLEHGYGRAISWLLENRFANMARILATLIVGFAFYQFIGGEMMPLADVGQAYGVLEAEPGTSFARTEEIVRRIEKIMAKHPEIEKASIQIGAETMFESFTPYYTGYAMPSVSGAMFMLTLSDMTKRDKSIWEVIDAVQKEAVETIPGIRRFQIKEMGSDVMASSAAPVQLIVTGKDLPLLESIGQQVEALARETEGMFQVATSWTMGLPSFEMDVDLERATEAGLTPEEISRQAYYAMRGGLTAEFWREPNVRQNTILVRYEEGQRRDGADLSDLKLLSRDGKQIPLKSVASVEESSAPTLIEHDGLRRALSILGFYRKGGPPSIDLSMGIQMEAMEKINFPPGYTIEMRGDMTQMMDSFRRMLKGLGLALVFIFLVLVAQFRGFLQPLQMIFSVPLELSGVFLALFLAHQSFSTVSILGVIVLTGMDITAAILLIDLIIRYRDRGVPRDQAVIEACPQRLRPILMTSIIYIVVMVPIAFFPKTGLDAYSPLAVVVIGGLISGTVLTLFDIPIMHTYVDDFVKWINRTFLKRDWEWPVTIHEEEVNA